MISGCTAWAGISAWNAYKDGQTTESQDKTYNLIVANSGAPPGFRAVQSFDYKFLFFFSVRAVIFIPENAQGKFPEALEQADSIVILFQADESAHDREQRELLYSTGDAGPPPAMREIFEKLNIPTVDKVTEMKRGTIPGHRFPLPYVIPNINVEKLAEMENKKGRNRASRPLPSNQMLAFVDLTPPDTKGSCMQVFVFKTTTDGITPEFLEEICKNFRPGE